MLQQEVHTVSTGIVGLTITLTSALRVLLDLCGIVTEHCTQISDIRFIQLREQTANTGQQPATFYVVTDNRWCR
jgi:hypothetical protein